jgi:hypothetical protein
MIPRTSAMFVSCAPGAFLGGSQGGGGGGGGEGMPPWLHATFRNGWYLEADGVWGSTPKYFLGRFLLFLADFAIFSGFVN